MNEQYACFADVAREIEPPDEGILTRTLLNNDRVKVVVFGFAPGEELSEHTATMPAILHFLEGEAELTLGPESIEGKPGTWVYMAPNLVHSVKTKSAVIMLLVLVK